MKLKYILPVATIASVATAVTPLAVSCSCSKWEYEWNFIKKGKYTSKVTQAEPTSLTEEQVTQKYFDDLNANHQILADDIFVQFNKQYEQFIDPMMKDYVQLRTLNAKLNVEKVDTQSHLMSMRYFMEMDATMSIPPEEPYIMHILVDTTIKNIPFEVKWIESGDEGQKNADQYWSFQTTVANLSSEDIDDIIEILNENDGWSVNGREGIVGGSGGESWKIVKFDFNKSKLPSTEEDIDAFMMAVGFEQESHYLEKIPHN